jgi:hypothetical protein
MMPERYKRGDYDAQFMKGEDMPKNMLKKFGSRELHVKFVADIKGLHLLRGKKD